MKHISYLFIVALLVAPYNSFAQDAQESCADETQRSVTCPCEQAAQQCHGCASCEQTTRCSTKSMTTEDMVQCAHCPCSVMVTEHTKSPAVCACCQAEEGRTALCLCEEHAAANDCLGCNSKKKINETQN